MRDLFRFLFRIRNLALFLALMVLAMSLVMQQNMHQRAQAISSSNAIVGQIYDWRSGITEFASLRDVNKDLADALARERERTLSLPARHDSGRLMVDTVRQMRYRLITARVINSTAHKEKNYILLDKGELDGINEGMGVMGANGIVGVVRDVTPHYSLLISVLSSEIPYSVQLRGEDQYFGLLRWKGGDTQHAMFEDLDKHVPVHVGDTVETRGQGPFPMGTTVGVVDSLFNDPSIPFHTVHVKLSEDLSRGGYVHVVKDLLKNERAPLDTILALP